MKYLHLILFCILCINVKSQVNTSLSYSQQLAKSKELLTETTDSSFSHQLQKELTENIFTFWYGTKWDYNGYTNKPNQGVIACGYFVSTTLKHIGFNMNRYDIAKMYSSDIVKVLCHDDYKILYDFESFRNYCNNLKDGIYILGLSNHVGILSVEKGRPYFIHSDYSSEDGVRKESIQTSFALEYSDSFWVGNFSNHSETINWYKENHEYSKIKD
jgi:hypothetical protein